MKQQFDLWKGNIAMKKKIKKIIIIIICCNVALTILYNIIQVSMDHDESFVTAMEFLHENNEVVEKYGIIEKTGRIKKGHIIKRTHNDGSAHFEFIGNYVYDVKIHLILVDNNWVVYSYAIR